MHDTPATPSAPRPRVTVRALQPGDHAAWLPLWDGYNAFYGREGATALAPHITQGTWARFLDNSEPMFALVATTSEPEAEGKPAPLLGLAHFLYHRSTTRLEGVCYLQDLFTAPGARGQGVGRALIQAVYADAQARGVRRVYWQTQASNAAGRLLYDRVARHLGFIVYAHDV
jgi:GNAT superfamily N-acetyltransferase